MIARRKGWDWWSELELHVLADYLQGFTRAVRGKSQEAICLDLFAGSFEAPTPRARDLPRVDTDRARHRACLHKARVLELASPAARLRADIATARPADDRWRVFDGDCNQTLPSALAWLDPFRWAPTFAFLDPRGLQVAWDNRRGTRGVVKGQADEGRAMDPDA